MIVKMKPASYHALARGKDLREWAISKSLLSDFYACPYSWKLRHDSGDVVQPSAGMDFGSALDLIITEPGEAEKLIEVVDAASWQGKAAQVSRQNARQQGRIPLLSEDAQAVRQCAESFRKHMERHDIGENWQTQVAAFHAIEVEGQSFTIKALADLWNAEHGMLADIKTTNSLDEWDIRRTCKRFRYAWQAAMYIDAFAAHGILVEQYFDFHFIETSAPFRTRILRMLPEDIEQARAEYLAALQVWKTCVELPEGQEWPGKELPKMFIRPI